MLHGTYSKHKCSNPESQYMHHTRLCLVIFAARDSNGYISERRIWKPSWQSWRGLSSQSSRPPSVPWRPRSYSWRSRWSRKQSKCHKSWKRLSLFRRHLTFVWGDSFNWWNATGAMSCSAVWTRNYVHFESFKHQYSYDDNDLHVLHVSS